MNAKGKMKMFAPDIIVLHESDNVIQPAGGAGFLYTRNEWKEIRRKIDDFYKEYSDDDISEYNRKVENHEFQRTAVTKQNGNQRKDGYVYLISHNGLYKIGMSKNVPSRVKQIGTKMPHDVVLVHSVWTNDAAGLELSLHEEYAGKRMNGEWFSLSDGDVDAIVNGWMT